MIKFEIFTIFLLIGNIKNLPLIDDNNNNNNNNNGIDLTNLDRSAIYGKPIEKSKEIYENSTQNPEELSGYYEGDILFPTTLQRNGLVDQTTLWPNGIVPYKIDPSFPQKDLDMIQKAMDIYHKYTCIRFRPKNGHDEDYIHIVNGNTGCWSLVGRIGKKQEINLYSPYCTTKIGTILHELMHCLGFLHEQNRYERDDYVNIIWSNIQQQHKNNFNKAKNDETNSYGIPYDFRSVLHYSPTAFSINGQPTIVPKDPSKKTKMGQRDGFSRGDILKINARYNCPNPDPGAHLTTETNNIDNNIDNNNSNNNKDGLLAFLYGIFNH